MIVAAALIAAYLCLPPLQPARTRLPEFAVARQTEGSLRARVLDWGTRCCARVRTMLGGDRLSPAVLLDAAAALDVICACLRSGMSPERALSAAADGASDRIADPLAQCAARMAVGAHAAWESLATEPALAPLAAAGRRASESGTELARALTDTAADYRSSAHDAAQAVAEKAGVLIAGPLALCFLPAFVVLGLIPTIAGLADEMFIGLVPS